MEASALIVLNFEEVRRRSIKLWSNIPDSFEGWRPDTAAFSILEMIRHVLEGEHLFHVIIKNRGDLGDYQSPWKNRPFTNIEGEITFSKSYREEFLDMVSQFSDSDFSTIRIERKEVGQSKTLGDYLNRMAYHEAVHTGQMLSYIRKMGLKVPSIWD